MKKIIAITLVIVSTLAFVIADNSRFYKAKGTVTYVTKDYVSVKVDGLDGIYSFYGNGYNEGDKVTLKFDNNRTATPYDDLLVNVR